MASCPWSDEGRLRALRVARKVRPRPLALGAKGTEGRGLIRGCRGEHHVPDIQLASRRNDPRDSPGCGDFLSPVQG
jgi:hypothetical protein